VLSDHCQLSAAATIRAEALHGLTSHAIICPCICVASLLDLWQAGGSRLVTVRLSFPVQRCFRRPAPSL